MVLFENSSYFVDHLQEAIKRHEMSNISIRRWAHPACGRTGLSFQFFGCAKKISTLSLARPLEKYFSPITAESRPFYPAAYF
jgi:hypothetical protein